MLTCGGFPGGSSKGISSSMSCSKSPHVPRAVKAVSRALDAKTSTTCAAYIPRLLVQKPDPTRGRQTSDCFACRHGSWSSEQSTSS